MIFLKKEAESLIGAAKYIKRLNSISNRHVYASITVEHPVNQFEAETSKVSSTIPIYFYGHLQKEISIWEQFFNKYVRNSKANSTQASIL